MLRAVSLALLISILPGTAFSAVSPELASANGRCAKSKDPAERVHQCSLVLRSSRDPALLERTFNRRGLANMALLRFQDAADDFTEVIRRNPKIAGYYDNRQAAYRSMGRSPQALQDANTAVRLAPTYSFVFRSRGLVYAELGHDLALEDFTRAIGIDPTDSGLFTDRGRMRRPASRSGKRRFTRRSPEREILRNGFKAPSCPASGP